jgi:endoplasmic reticulum-Golgi intermediate compartment protein 3
VDRLLLYLYFEFFDFVYLILIFSVSIIGWILIAILVFFETRSYLTPKFQELIAVDKTLSEQLKINVNITFHALTCNEVHLDVMDVAGDNQLNVEHAMMKQRLNNMGKTIGKAGVEIIGEVRKFEYYF